MSSLLKKDEKILKKDLFKYIVLVFMIGGIAGFIYEELFFLLFDHKLVYRGFLYGPFLPVYAWGSLLLIFLKKFKEKPLLVFLLAMLITGVLEYLTGYVMFKIWNRKWWDYTGLFLNINGFVCFRSIFTFGLGAFLLIYLIDPLIIKFINKKNNLVNIIVISFLIVYLLDNIITFLIRY